MVDVLLTHSYFLCFDPKEFRAMMPYPPLGTLYAAAYARSLGYTVALADSMLATDEEHLTAAITSHRPKVVVIYDDDFNYLTKMCLKRMRQAAFRMSSIARAAGCRVIVHGSDSADHIREYLDHGAEYVICGEGELTLGELLHAIFNGTPSPEAIPGIAFLRQESVHSTDPRKVMKNLDALPFPARDLVDVDSYRKLWRRTHGYFSVNVVTTRGCPFHCNWCAKPIYGQVYNSRSPENVVDELVSLKANVGPDHVWFCDDIFGLTPGWIDDFSREVRARDAVIPFKCLGRVDLLRDESTVHALRKAGCTSVWVGAESGSQKILDAMEKGTTVRQIYETTVLLKRAGISVGFFLQYGYPGETDDDILLTQKMLRECMPDEIGISVSYPLPGTTFYERVREGLGEKRNWMTSEDLDLLIPGKHVPDYYRLLHTLTHKRFRLWQGLDLIRTLPTRPWLVTPRKLRRVASVGYHCLTLPGLQKKLNRLAVLQNREVESLLSAPDSALAVSQWTAPESPRNGRRA